MEDHPFKPGAEVWLSTPKYRYSSEPTRYTRAVVVQQYKNGNVSLDTTGKKQFHPWKSQGRWRLSERGDGDRDAYLSTEESTKMALDGERNWLAWKRREDVVYHVAKYGRSMPDDLAIAVHKRIAEEGGWKS